MKTAIKMTSAAVAIFAVAMVLRALFRSEKRSVTVTTGEGKASVTVVPGELHRNDRVAYYAAPPAKGARLARVVAFPGQRVKVVAGIVQVDGSAYKGAKLFVTRGLNRREIAIPTGCLFLVGEEVGPDSISHGPLPRARIAGKVVEGD